MPWMPRGTRFMPRSSSTPPTSPRRLRRVSSSSAVTTDTWLADHDGSAVLVWSSPPGAALTGELLHAARAVREPLGPDARPTICFDRAGWSPALFAELVGNGFDICTYRKGPTRPEPRSALTSSGRRCLGT